MKEKIQELKQKFNTELDAVKDTKALEDLRLVFFSKKGLISDLMKELGKVPNEQKKEFGQLINGLKKELNDKFDEKKLELVKLEEESEINATEAYDESMPTRCACGSYHPITLVQRDLEDIFKSMGFDVEDYNEIVDDYHCFEALNIPKFHPARDMQDTYYLSTPNQLLKSHTSAAQNAIMRKYGDALKKQKRPIKAVFPGRCFRNEAIDACHENTFFQMEGIMIDEDISISNLIYFMKTMLSEVFERDVTVRLRPGFFPFVEPGFELDIQCLICGGDGCPSCKNSGWLELCPCGMIHPNVLKYGGINTEEEPDKYTGFAFGLGLTRLAMMKFGIKDIRVLNEFDLNSLSQFVSK
ncbi:MAG: phenylalanine--tRNA ligase subunit alpha [Lachnospiraceae bacterium]|nr:phenylalanine--tRNA ligase subunit alpha [Lachnospiraceae bacterium]